MCEFISCAEHTLMSASPGMPISVFCRVRPGPDTADIVVSGDRTVAVKDPSRQVEYEFAGIFGESAPQSAVFSRIGVPSIDRVEDGFNAAVLFYGQTGSGKTYSMTGSGEGDGEGLLPRCMRDLLVRTRRWTDARVVVSAVEVYLDRLRDLVEPERSGDLVIRDAGESRVDNLAEVQVSSWRECAAVLRSVAANRSTAETDMNADSSRAHTIITVRVNRRLEHRTRSSRLMFVDLAGSEDVARSGATGVRGKEACATNRSLLALGQVINALASGAAHTPYRDSKLTHIMQSSLAGNCAMSVVVTVRGGNSRETIATLNFGQCALRVQMRPVVGDRVESVADLRAELQAQTEAAAAYSLQYAAAQEELVAMAAVLERVRAPCPVCRADAATGEDAELSENDNAAAVDESSQAFANAVAAAAEAKRQKNEEDLQSALASVAVLMDRLRAASDTIARQSEMNRLLADRLRMFEPASKH